MIICSCNVITDGQVKACVAPGAACPRTAAQVYECLGCSPKCGRCARTIRQIVANALMGVDVPIEVTACAADCASACPLAKAQHAHDEMHAPLVAAHAEAIGA